jgi:hypothetical protein
MADQRVNGNLILIGSQGGTFAFGCQPAGPQGGGFTYLLPTTIPQIGQTLTVASVFNGNMANLHVSPAGVAMEFLSFKRVVVNSGHDSTNIHHS